MRHKKSKEDSKAFVVSLGEVLSDGTVFEQTNSDTKFMTEQTRNLLFPMAAKILG